GISGAGRADNLARDAGDQVRRQPAAGARISVEEPRGAASLPNSTTTPPLAILCRGIDRTGVLYEMTSVIVRHGGYIHSVDILERGDRSAISWELYGVDDEDALIADLETLEVVTSVERVPSMLEVFGKRIIVIGGGAQVGQVALGAIAEAD